MVRTGRPECHAFNLNDAEKNELISGSRATAPITEKKTSIRTNTVECGPEIHVMVACDVAARLIALVVCGILATESDLPRKCK